MHRMNQESRWSEGPRVRVRTRVVRPSADPPLPATGSIRRNLHDVERRFMALQSQTIRGPSEDVLSEFLAILDDLRAISTRLLELAGRRDIVYVMERRLAILNQYCLWLTRRVSAEFLLLHQLRLEHELRRLIGPQAYQMYLRLEDIEDTAREVDALNDRDLMARLREGTLAREILEQIGDDGEAGGLSPEET